MRVARLAVVLLSCWAVAAFGQWRSKDGTPIPDNESRKARNGFGVSLLVTADQDWKEKWERPDPPTFTAASSVKVGGKLTVLIFIVNPLPDAGNRVNVRCDILLKRPDGTTSFDQKDMACMEGPLRGSPYNVRIAAPVIGFVGEPADPKGDWIVDVSLTDAVRGTTIPIRTSFRLE